MFDLLSHSDSDSFIVVVEVFVYYSAQTPLTPLPILHSKVLSVVTDSTPTTSPYVASAKISRSYYFIIVIDNDPSPICSIGFVMLNSKMIGL